MVAAGGGGGGGGGGDVGVVGVPGDEIVVSEHAASARTVMLATVASLSVEPNFMEQPLDQRRYALRIRNRPEFFPAAIGGVAPVFNAFETDRLSFCDSNILKNIGFVTSVSSCQQET
jgi:hypothetical protein